MEISPHVLVKKDVPAWLKLLMRDCIPAKAISAYGGSNTNSGKPREIFIHLDKILAPRLPRLDHRTAETFREQLLATLEAKVPAHLGNIVYADDRDSRALAKLVAQTFTSASERQISSFGLNQLLVKTGPRSKYKLRAGVTMVVAGAVVAGRHLSSLNLALRKYKAPQRFHYLVGITRTSSEKKLDQLQRSVVGGNLSNPNRLFSSVIDIFIPDDNPSISPWTRETATLKTLLASTTDSAAKRILTRRAKLLETAKTSGGLRNNLFWETVKECRPLRLRRDFQLGGAEYAEASQADVYFTILATIHDLRRHESHRAGTLRLDPECFNRLNDGVLQASLLRAASHEVDFESHPQQSSEMRRAIEQVFRNWDNEIGEACIELLLAMFEKRVRLTRTDISGCIDQLMSAIRAGDGKLSCIVILLCNQILNTLASPGVHSARS